MFSRLLVRILCLVMTIYCEELFFIDIVKFVYKVPSPTSQHCGICAAFFLCILSFTHFSTVLQVKALFIHIFIHSVPLALPWLFSLSISFTLLLFLHITLFLLLPSLPSPSPLSCPLCFPSKYPFLLLSSLS